MRVFGATAVLIVAACSSSSHGSPLAPGADAGHEPDGGGKKKGSDAAQGGSPDDVTVQHPMPSGPDATVASEGGSFGDAGNPNGSCTAIQVPSEAELVDTSSPTTVVGTGTAASCTFAALSSAVSKGGVVTFDCGPDPVTIPVSATLTPPTSNAYDKEAPLTIVLDGGGKVTLDGRGAVRILSWVHMGSWRINQDTLTLQRLRFINGKTTPTEQIPACPPANGIANTACSTGYDDGQGGALYMQDGNVRIIDCIFEDNEAAMLGPDTGGGAVYLYGTGSPSYVMRSSFLNNKASNAGGLGMLWAGAYVIDSLFEGNSAVGMGANDVDPTMCTCSNMGNDNQTGSGGNGGAIYKDGGDGVNLTICGTEIKGNSSNEFGPAVFLTADGSGAQLILDDDTITGNTSENPVWQWCTGVSTDNPHASGSGSPSPVGTTFCDSSGANCTMTCSS